MPSDRWQRVERLYHAALERAPAERARFLAEACQGDGVLLGEVQALLAQETAASPELPDRSAWEGTATFQETPGARLEAGAQVGPYKLEAAIGAGGMGQVFRAVDTRLRRTVAIKALLQASMPDPAQRRRFLQEARAASALHHPNIVVVHDISSYRGTDFLVMEYVAGQTLKELIPARGMALETIAQAGTQIAAALAAAHSAGIVHRDIKPANIMVTPDGQVKVLDFGVAKMTSALEGETQATIPGVVVGTVAYMSPEQTRGELVDGRSDIFSLGCVLYEAATGRRPFRGESTLAILHAIATETPAAPSSLRAELPAAFDQVIAACLAKKADQRPASAAEVARELQSLLAPPERVTVRRSDSRDALAVLPFQFRTAATDDQFLSVALADAVANRLASTGKLLVRPMASVTKYAGKETDWAQAARELNVQLVVEGTIQKMGPRIRVQVQAHRVADSFTLHSARYDGAMDDLFGLQDRIADSVSEVFAPREKAAGEPVSAPTKNPLAYELYLRAVDRLLHMDKFDTGMAIETITRVVDLDPNFADAWGRLAQACTQMGMHFDPDPQWFERGEHAIARTLELDPVHCDALCARGQILWSPSRGFQNRAALRAMNASLKINPTRDIARQFRGAVLFHLGFYDQAERDVEETLLINPGHVMSFQARGTIAMYRGDYQKATDLFERVLALNPANVHGHLFAALPAIHMGRLDVAARKVAKAREMFPEEPEVVAQMGLIAAHEGNFRAAEEMADQALESKRSLTHTHHTWHDAAGVYALCGKPEKAIAQLRRCAEMGLSNYLLFGSDPHLRGLHGHPEFQTLMSDLRREHEAFETEFALTGHSAAHGGPA